MTQKPKEELYKPSKSLDEIVGELQRVDSVVELQEKYNKNKFRPGFDSSEGLARMGAIVGRDPNTFVHNTDSSINFMANQFSGSILETQESDIKHYAPKILSNYTNSLFGFVNLQASNIREKVKKTNPKASSDEIEEVVKQNIYDLVGGLIRKMPHSQEYIESNKDLEHAFGMLEEIEESTEKGDYSRLVPVAVKDRGLPSAFSYSAAAPTWARELVQSDGYQRVIGKNFVKFADGKYSIDSKTLKDFTGDNLYAYAKMANQEKAFSSAVNQAKEEKKDKKK